MIKTIKILFNILPILIACQSMLAQNVSYYLDTLKVLDNNILANCKVYKNDNLVEESDVLLYPVIHKVPRFRLTGKLLLKEVEMDSIVRHGTTKKYFENRLILTSNFNHGKEINTVYYDHNGTEISKKEYLSLYNMHQPCGAIIGEYLIKGKREGE